MDAGLRLAMKIGEMIKSCAFGLYSMPLKCQGKAAPAQGSASEANTVQA